VAGVIKLNKEGYFNKGDSIVCTLTGHGLKDPESAIKISDKPLTLPPKLDKILEILEL
jgi:threonine synthase